MSKGLIIFDFDGTLGDTRRNIVTTMQMTIAELHLPNRSEEECAAIELAGFDIPGHYIKNVTFKNIRIDADKIRNHNILMQCCEGINFQNVCIR